MNIQLAINRATVMDDSSRLLQQYHANDWKNRDFSVQFVGENGFDAGGLKRDWYSLMAREIFNPNYALFKSSETDQNVFQPNDKSSVNEQHLDYFKFIGQFIAKAVIDDNPVNCHFSRFLYKHMMGIRPQLHDLRQIDEHGYKGLCWIADNDVTDVMGDTTFTADVENFGQRRVIDLKPNSSNTTLSEVNKAEYFELMVNYKLSVELKPQIDAFLEGFHNLIPQGLIANFEVSELERLIAGAAEIDVEDWHRNTLR